jgi:hypothetical protein
MSLLTLFIKSIKLEFIERIRLESPISLYSNWVFSTGLSSDGEFAG